MTSRVHTSLRRVSSLTRSARGVARTGILFVVSSDCDLLMEDEDVGSLAELVFFMITWQRPVVGPTVVALCIEIRLAMVPNACERPQSAIA